MTFSIQPTLNARDQDDEGLALAIDASGDVYVAGWTGSATGFPVKNAFQTTSNGSKELFVMKVKTDEGNTNNPCTFGDPTFVFNDCDDLVYSTYFGGSDRDSSAGDSAADQSREVAIAVDPSGFIYMTGTTDSDAVTEDFPITAGAFDTTCGTDGECDPNNSNGFSGDPDAFVAKFDPSPPVCTTNATSDCLESLVYATYLGGSDKDSGYGIAVDNKGNAYVTGFTSSKDFPGVGTATAPKFGEGPFGKVPGTFTGEDTDVFVATLNATGAALLSSTYVGGTGGEIGRGLALDASCNAYIVGDTSSPDFPLLSPVDTTRENREAFVSKIGNGGFSAFISNFNDGTVSVIDTQTMAVNAISVGVSPFGVPEGVAVHPDGIRAYVTTLIGDEVVVIDTTTNTVVQTIALPTSLAPVGVAVHPNGRWVYVANSGVDPGKTTHTISVIDTTTNTLLDLDPIASGTQQIELGIVTQSDVPFGIAVHPDGSRLYLTNLQGDSVTVLGVTEDPGTNLPVHTVDAVVPVGDAPQGIAVAMDGTVYVANSGSGVGTPPGSGTVSVIDASLTKINFVGPTSDIAVSGTPFGIAVHPNDTTVYVTDGEFNGNTLSILNFTPPPPAMPNLPPTFTIDTVVVGKGGRGVSVTPDGSLVFVANGQDNTVSVVSTANDTRLDVDPGTSGIQDIPVGGFPIAFGDFIAGPVFDNDGDGIEDLVDGTFAGGAFVPESNNNVNGSFTNEHLCGNSFGTIMSVPAGMSLDVTSPAGIVIEASGGDGSQQALVNACDFELLYDASDVTIINACSSLTTKVVSGPVEILLDSSGVVNVPSGVTVKVSEIASQQFEIRNLGNTAPIVVDVNGTQTQVDPGETEVVTVSIPGDFDGDGDVDQNDLNLLLPHRNEAAAGQAQFDLDGDGLITALDARILVTQCTLPRCAILP